MTKFYYLQRFKKKLLTLIILLLVFIFPLPIFAIIIFNSHLNDFFRFITELKQFKNFSNFNTTGYLNVTFFNILFFTTVFIFVFAILSLVIFLWKTNTLDKKKYKFFFLTSNFVLIIIASLLFSQIQIYYNFIISYCKNIFFNLNKFKNTALYSLVKSFQNTILNPRNIYHWIPYNSIIYISNFFLFFLVVYYGKILFFIGNKSKKNINSKIIKKIKNDYLDNNFEKKWYQRIRDYFFLPLTSNILISLLVSLVLVFIPIFSFLIFLFIQNFNYAIIFQTYGWKKFIDFNLNNILNRFNLNTTISGFNFLFFSYLIIIFWTILMIGFFIFLIIIFKNQNFLTSRFLFSIIISNFLGTILMIILFFNGAFMLNNTINKINQIILKNPTSLNLNQFIKNHFNCYQNANNIHLLKKSFLENWSLIFILILLITVQSLIFIYDLVLLKKLKNIYFNQKNILYLF